MSQHEIQLKRDPVQVLHAAILSTQEGIKGAAERIGRSPGILHNKFSEAMPHYDITAREFVALAKLADSSAPIEAMCEQFDGTFLPLPIGQAGDDDVLQAYVDIIRHMGELSQEFTEARADGIIEPAEYAALELKGHRTIQAIMRYLAELKTTVREISKASPSLAVARS